MLQLATADLPWAVVDDFELRQPAPSFSYLTAAAMRNQFPNAQLFWIMGSDQWDALPHWKNSHQLAKLLEFIVLARGQSPTSRPGYRLHLVHGQHPASASAVRHAISNQAEFSEWLHPAVSQWILEKNLYPCHK